MLGQQTVKIPFLGAAGCVTGSKYLPQTAGIGIWLWASND
jgi:hypothetical protein